MGDGKAITFPYEEREDVGSLLRYQWRLDNWFGQVAFKDNKLRVLHDIRKEVIYYLSQYERTETILRNYEVVR